MDGITLCRKIKQNININHIPIILLTAKSKAEDQIEGLEIGADAYIVKPFNTELLRTTISNLIANRERLRGICTRLIPTLAASISTLRVGSARWSLMVFITLLIKISSLDFISIFVIFSFFFLMLRRPPRSTLSSSSAASDVYKRQQ